MNVLGTTVNTTWVLLPYFINGEMEAQRSLVICQDHMTSIWPRHDLTQHSGSTAHALNHHMIISDCRVYDATLGCAGCEEAQEHSA